MTTTALDIPVKPHPAVRNGPRTEPRLVEPRTLLEHVQQTMETIRRRAYEIFESRGREDGRDLVDWFRASAELLRPVLVDLADDDGELKVTAEVPGFSAGDIELGVEPRRLVLSGTTETRTERKTGEALRSERKAESFLHSLNLPVAVDPDRASASLRNGVLTVTLPKAELAPAPVQVPVTS
jgi:HSP20 family protein